MAQIDILWEITLDSIHFGRMQQFKNFMIFYMNSFLLGSFLKDFFECFFQLFLIFKWKLVFSQTNGNLILIIHRNLSEESQCSLKITERTRRKRNPRNSTVICILNSLILVFIHSFRFPGNADKKPANDQDGKEQQPIKRVSSVPFPNSFELIL